MRSFDLVSTELVILELLALLVLGVVLFLVVRAARSGASRAMDGSQKSGAAVKETLDRRYASGEITREEYLTIRDDIKRNDDA